MKNKNVHASLFIPLAVLGFLTASSEASVMCGVFQGSRCDTPLYYMQFCADITLRQGYCEELCQKQQPICNAQDFSPWVSAYQDIGRRGIRGELQNHANEFDEAGTLTYLSEKTVTVCKKTLVGWRPLPFHAPKTCPKAKTASASTCIAGTVFDSVRGSCVVQDSSGASGTQDYQNLMNQSGMLVATQNQHFGEIASTDTNLSIHTVVAETNLPGLVKDTQATVPTLDLGSNSNTFKTENSANPSRGSGSMTTSGGDSSFTAASVNGVNPDQVFGSISAEAKEEYRPAGSAQGRAGFSESGTSWFGSSGAATAGGASGEVGFTKTGEAGRGLASTGEVLNIEDPANYFMMSDIEVSLFKRVTEQCRRKEKEMVLSSGL